METKKTSKRYSPELRERAVRMVAEHRGEHGSQWAAIGSIAAKIGCTAETLRGWVRQAERDQGLRAGLTSAGAGPAEGAGAGGPGAAAGERDPAQGVRVFCDGGARPPVQAMIAFIDDHRDVYGVEPICRDLPIAPSTYHAHAARRADPEPCTGARQRRDLAFAARSGGSGRRTSGLRRPQGLAAARPRGRRRGALHRRPPDAPDGPARDCSRKISENHDQRQGGALSARPGEPGLQGAGAEQALGLRLHLRRHLGRLRLRRLRDRRLRPAHRRLAGVADRRGELRAGRARAGDPRPTARCAAAVSSTTAIEGSQYLSRSATPSASARPASSPRSAASATAMTMRSPRRSTACSRPRSSTGAARGAASRPSSSPPSNGSTGSTTAACSSRSATSRPPRPRRATTPSWRPSPWRRRTQTNLPPENPARFQPSALASCRLLPQEWIRPPRRGRRCPGPSSPRSSGPSCWRAQRR